jgi:hypothetical protein
MSDKQEYIAVLHVYMKEQSEVDALMAADDIKQHLESDILDKEDLGEAVDVVQVIPAFDDPSPSASVMQLRRARNILIRTRIKECFDTSRDLHRIAWELERRSDPEMSNYDHGSFLPIAAEVLAGGNPL